MPPLPVAYPPSIKRHVRMQLLRKHSPHRSSPHASIVPLKLRERLDLLAGAREHAQNVEADLNESISHAHRQPHHFHRSVVLTVLLNGRHWPTVTWSPSSTRNAGLTCAARLVCRFSYREYLGMKCRYSRRMMRVRCIFVLTTVPVKIRPRMETMPVKGHFLSAKHHTSVYLTSNLWPSKLQACKLPAHSTMAL